MMTLLRDWSAHLSWVGRKDMMRRRCWVGLLMRVLVLVVWEVLRSVTCAWDSQAVVSQ